MLNAISLFKCKQSGLRINLASYNTWNTSFDCRGGMCTLEGEGSIAVVIGRTADLSPGWLSQVSSPFAVLGMR